MYTDAADIARSFVVWAASSILRIAVAVWSAISVNIYQAVLPACTVVASLLVDTLRRILQGLWAASSIVIQSTYGWLHWILMHARDAPVAVRFAILRIAFAVRFVILQIAFAVWRSIRVTIDAAVFDTVVRHAHFAHFQDERYYDIWQDSLMGVFAQSSGALFEKLDELRRLPLRDVRAHRAISPGDATQEKVDRLSEDRSG